MTFNVNTTTKQTRTGLAHLKEPVSSPGVSLRELKQAIDQLCTQLGVTTAATDVFVAVEVLSPQEVNITHVAIAASIP